MERGSDRRMSSYSRAFRCSVHSFLAMSQTMQRVSSAARLTLSRGNSVHGSSQRGSNAALQLLQQAGTASSPRTLTLRATNEGARRARRSGVLAKRQMATLTLRGHRRLAARRGLQLRTHARARRRRTSRQRQLCERASENPRARSRCTGTLIVPRAAQLACHARRSRPVAAPRCCTYPLGL